MIFFNICKKRIHEICLSELLVDHEMHSSHAEELLIIFQYILFKTKERNELHGREYSDVTCWNQINKSFMF